MNKNIIGGAIGNSIEWYDYAIFGFSASTLSHVLFPQNHNSYNALIAVFMLFAIGFVSRPLGGMVFGYIGDKIGRKPMLKITVLAMSIPTFLIGLMPSHAVIGVYAIYLIAVLRLIQGLAMGGEFTGSVAYLTEISPKNRKGLFGSFAYFTTTFGIFLGSLVITMTHQIFTDAQINAGMWRAPFLLAGALGVVAYILRSRIEDTGHEKPTKSYNPVIESFKHSKIVMLKCIGLNFFNAVGFYTFVILMPTYLHKFLNMPISMSHVVSTIGTITLLLIIPLSGWLSDKVGQVKQTIIVSIILLIVVAPLFNYMSVNSTATNALIVVGMLAIFGTIQGCLPRIFVGLFHYNTRLSAFSMSFNVSNALFAGTAPLIALYIAKHTGNYHYIIFYPMFALLVFIGTLFTLRNNANKN